MASPSSIRACAFDVFGTLLDLTSLETTAHALLGPRTPGVLGLWRRKQLEYSWISSLVGDRPSFSDVTRWALEHALSANGETDQEVGRQLLAAHDRLETYEEVPAILEHLRSRGVPRFVLSNGDPDQLTRNLGAAGLHASFDAVLSAWSVGSFKPAPNVYRSVVEAAGVPAEAIAFFSSNGWDVVGAQAFGLRSCWINRTDATPESLPYAPTIVAPSLSEALGALGLRAAKTQ